MAWDIEVLDGCAVVRMNTNKVNVQNDHFFADLHGAFDRLEHLLQVLRRPVESAERNGHSANRAYQTEFMSPRSN
jgi:hypothetical protein